MCAIGFTWLNFGYGHNPLFFTFHALWGNSLFLFEICASAFKSLEQQIRIFKSYTQRYTSPLFWIFTPKIQSPDFKTPLFVKNFHLNYCSFGVRFDWICLGGNNKLLIKICQSGLDEKANWLIGNGERCLETSLRIFWFTDFYLLLLLR
jgi:hypothetical protein